MKTTELEAAINTLNMQITTLKNELASNTQALGHTTIALEGITKALINLASETGAWRKDDTKHHEEEGSLDKEKVELLKQVKKLFENKQDIKYETTI